MALALITPWLRQVAFPFFSMTHLSERWRAHVRVHSPEGLDIGDILYIYVYNMAYNTSPGPSAVTKCLNRHSAATLVHTGIQKTAQYNAVCGTHPGT